MINDARSFVMGPTPIFARLLDWLQWRRIIDERVGRDDFKVTVGRRVEALLVNIHAGRKPLYKVQEFYEEQDVELLFGEGITASDFNDDALGRALDVLHDADIETLYTALAMSTIQSLKMS